MSHGSARFRVTDSFLVGYTITTGRLPFKALLTRLYDICSTEFGGLKIYATVDFTVLIYHGVLLVCRQVKSCLTVWNPQVKV